MAEPQVVGHGPISPQCALSAYIMVAWLPAYWRLETPCVREGWAAKKAALGLANMLGLRFQHPLTPLAVMPPNIYSLRLFSFVGKEPQGSSCSSHFAVSPA